MSGETMRDRIAMAALTGDLAACEDGDPVGAPSPSHAAILARRAYIFADAMLAARGGDAPQPQQGDAVKQQMLETLRYALRVLIERDSDAHHLMGKITFAIAAAEKEQQT